LSEEKSPITGRLVSAAVTTSLLVSPRPAALLLRRLFAASGARGAEQLARHAPPAGTVASLVDERYAAGPDALLDVHRPTAASVALPLVFWVHGGAFCGGTKDELADYFRLLASHGYVVAAPRYSLAPEHRYPMPVHQTMEALDFLQLNAERLRLDPTRIVLAGDSAGAHLAAQLAALVTTPGYAGEVGVTPTLDPSQLRAVALACGPFDRALADTASTAAGRQFVRIVLWAYSGTRRYLTDPEFASWSVTEHVTAVFPPTLLTVGNADPLRPHSELLAERLGALDVPTETLFFPDDREPPLGHEYQFDLDTEDGRLFLERLLSFLSARTG
jgi:acetyl esterase/lipase